MTQTAVITSMLNSALAHISKSIDSSPTLPVLACVRLHAADSAKRLSIEATDLVTSQRVTIPCALTMNEFDVVVPHRVLKEYVALGNPMHRLDLHSTPQGLYVQDISDRANFKGFDPAEFPRVPTVDDTWLRIAEWKPTWVRRGLTAGGIRLLKAEVETLERYLIPDGDKRFTEESFLRHLRLTFTPNALHLRAARPTALALRTLVEFPADVELTVDVPRGSLAAALAAHNGESECVEVLAKTHEDGTLTLCLRSDVREVFVSARQPSGGALETPELLWRSEVDARSLLSVLSKVTQKDLLALTFAAKELTLERGDQTVDAAVSWSKSAEVEFVGRACYTLTSDVLSLLAHAVKAQKKAAQVSIGLALFENRLPMLALFSERGVEYVVLDEVVSEARQQSQARAGRFHQERHLQAQVDAAQAAFDALPPEARAKIIAYQNGQLSWQDWWKVPDEWRRTDSALRDAQRSLDSFLGRRPFSA